MTDVLGNSIVTRWPVMTEAERRAHDNCCVWGDCTELGPYFIELGNGEVVFLCAEHAEQRTAFMADCEPPNVVTEDDKTDFLKRHTEERAQRRSEILKALRLHPKGSPE